MPPKQNRLIKFLLGGLASLTVLLFLIGLALVVGTWVGLSIGVAIKAARFIL